MKTDEVQQLLAAYGLSEPEVKAFYHLAKLGEATATEVAKESGLSRAEVYRAADGLERRGLLERTMDRPQKFLPRPIDEVADRLIGHERNRLADLQEKRDMLVQHWPKPAGPEEAEEERFQVQRGRAQIEGVLRRMVARAEREIAIAAPHRTVNRLLTWGLGDSLREAVERDVQVRLLTQITPDLLAEEAGVPPGVDMRHSEVPTYAQFVVVDQREIGIYVTVDPVVGTTGRPETLLWMNSPDFTMGQQTLFDDLWMQSTDREARRTEIETGHRPRQLRVVRGRLPRVDEMRAIISRAEKEILIAQPDPDSELDTSRVLASLKRAAAKGVKVRLLARPLSEVHAAEGIEAREGVADPRFGLLLVDGTEGLVTVFERDGAGAEERSVVVTVPTALDFVREVFESAWGP